MEKKQSNPGKRLDLQGIRALAIIVVLGFHFYPQFVPNGYLGVDQFFVLSGFLMCMLLKRAENQSSCSLVSLFYSKRFKRILPLYLLVIFLSMIALYNYFPDTAVETNKESATHALLFVSNRPKTDQENYFTMLSIAVDIFTHTWSLSVEIQFYFLVPILFLVARKLSLTNQCVYYSFIGAISALFFFLLSPSAAFNSVFARVWQFVIGMIVFLITNAINCSGYQLVSTKDDMGQFEKALHGNSNRISAFNLPALKYPNSLPNVVLFSLIAITAVPIALPDSVVRPLVTLLTGFLMLISNGNFVLSAKPLTYIGDISYALYLIHWPLYAYWKLTAEGDQTALVGALLASVVLAVLIFETFEKWYLKLSSTSVGLLVVMLYFLNLTLICKDEITRHFEHVDRNFSRLDGLNENMTLEDAEKFNHEWNVNDYENLYTNTCIYETKKPKTPLGWCNHTDLDPTAKYRLAIIGNSWTANHATLFYQECRHKAKIILQGSTYGCEPLYPTVNADECKENFEDFAKRIKEENPDHVFIVSRWITIGDKLPDNVTGSGFDNDPIYQVMKNQTLRMLSSTKYKLHILDAVPSPNVTFMNDIVPMLKKDKDPVEIDNLLENQKDYQLARDRHAQLVKDGKGRVNLIDYVPEFWNNATQTFRYFDDRGFAYFTTPSHLSPRGLEHVRHLWREVCDRL